MVGDEASPFSWGKGLGFSQEDNTASVPLSQARVVGVGGNVDVPRRLPRRQLRERLALVSNALVRSTTSPNPSLREVTGTGSRALSVSSRKP